MPEKFSTWSPFMIIFCVCKFVLSCPHTWPFFAYVWFISELLWLIINYASWLVWSRRCWIEWFSLYEKYIRHNEYLHIKVETSLQILQTCILIRLQRTCILFTRKQHRQKLINFFSFSLTEIIVRRRSRESPSIFHGRRCRWSRMASGQSHHKTLQRLRDIYKKVQDFLLLCERI